MPSRIWLQKDSVAINVLAVVWIYVFYASIEGLRLWACTCITTCYVIIKYASCDLRSSYKKVAYVRVSHK
jgi:hypothetical protein